ncbi:MAG: cache domain-containing protein [Hoeflea sp.]|nr:cache domain-containing protein [Hoeflea sp.]
MLVILPLLLGATMWRWNSKFDAALISKVNGDLTIAHQYLTQLLVNTGDHITALGDSIPFAESLESADPESVAGLLSDTAMKRNLDFLYLADGDGRLLAAAEGRGPPLTDVAEPVFASARNGTPRTAIDVLASGQLAAIDPALAERAAFSLIPTPNAAPKSTAESTSGMVVHSASPVALPDGRRGVLVGGVLLNRNLDFIDTINDLVYQEASLPEGSRGTATLFLDDVRVSTNVRLFEGSRALGTRVSDVVRATVLGEGRTWLDRAFVVNDWYISAYEPIVDSHGERVGMLYVGFLESPFRQSKLATLVAVCAAFLAVTVFSIPLFLRWAGSIFRPLEKIVETIGAVENGDMGARTGTRPANDEIGRVATHLDGLLDRIEQRDAELRAFNEELNDRVEARTSELQATNKQLEEMTRQLVMSEKLAAIGEITASVAHEINNPIAVIQGNLEVLRAIIGDRAKDAETELRLIDEQTDRVSQIVTRLLQFARPDEYSGSEASSLPGEAVKSCMPLIRHLLNKNEISFDFEDRASFQVAIGRTELQQVLINLMVNAIHAMPEGGRLTVLVQDCRLAERDGVEITVSDTGAGIQAAELQRIFDPFYTTKKGKGTGLGLSITQMLVVRQGGTISVESEPGHGARFVIRLPTV